MWKGIVGKSFTPETFGPYVASLKWGGWRPKFIVVHNTGAPTRKQWHGATPAAQRIKNLEAYYRDQQHWSAGPHLFIADDLIWTFTSMTTPGVHSPSWNFLSLGFEMVGDFNFETFDGGSRDNAVAALGIVHAALGLNPDTIRLHKEDPQTTHKDCPGKNVIKSSLIALVHAYIANMQKGDHAPGAAP
ncbi:MAG: N-acetylmuramoyl-L-alanine amidase [Nitrobacter sp.]